MNNIIYICLTLPSLSVYLLSPVHKKSCLGGWHKALLCIEDHYCLYNVSVQCCMMGQWLATISALAPRNCNEWYMYLRNELYAWRFKTGASGRLRTQPRPLAGQHIVMIMHYPVHAAPLRQTTLHLSRVKLDVQSIRVDLVSGLSLAICCITHFRNPVAYPGTRTRF